MAISVYCVTPLAISIAYVLIYAAALIALLVKNKARFTNQTKIVLVLLFMASSV